METLTVIHSNARFIIALDNWSQVRQKFESRLTLRSMWPRHTHIWDKSWPVPAREAVVDSERMAELLRGLRRLSPVLSAYIVILARWLSFILYEAYVAAGGGGGALPVPTLSPWQRLIAEVGLWAMVSLFVGLSVRLWIDRKSLATGTDVGALISSSASTNPEHRWELRRYHFERVFVSLVAVIAIAVSFMDVVAPFLGLLTIGAFVLAPLPIITAYLLVVLAFSVLVKGSDGSLEPAR